MSAFFQFDDTSSVAYAPFMATTARLAKAEFFESRNLDGHLALVRRQVERSLADPETRQLAVKIVSGSFDWIQDPRTGQQIPVVEAWGKRFHAPTSQVCGPKQDQCELLAIWEFLVYNIRYVYDIESADTFATLRASLLAGGGDCDDQTVAVCSLARAIGFASCYARVVSMRGEEWEHVYPLVGCPKDNPQIWIPLDMTVAGKPPGWEVDGPAAVRDFPMSET